MNCCWMLLRKSIPTTGLILYFLESRIKSRTAEVLFMSVKQKASKPASEAIFKRSSGGMVPYRRE